MTRQEREYLRRQINLLTRKKLQIDFEAQNRRLETLKRNERRNRVKSQDVTAFRLKERDWKRNWREQNRT